MSISDLDNVKLGEAIPNYVRRTWRLREQWTIEDAEKIELRDEIKERLFLLGVDDKLLLEVEPARVMSRVEELETEAILEDGGLRRS